MATVTAEPTFRRAVILMSATSLLVPAAGVVTAPLLAHALSVDGRGALAAALAPAALMLNAATLGLPDALTYHLAKRPEIARYVLARASLITTALGALVVGIVFLALPYLRDGSHRLGTLIMLATVLTVPALIVNLLRGAAVGQQMWGRVSAERFINVVSRVVAFGALFLMHELTVTNAVWVSVITPLLAGLVYRPLLKRQKSSSVEQSAALGSRLDERVDEQEAAAVAQVVRPVPLALDSEDAVELIDHRIRAIVRFGTRVWFGSVMEMLLSRSAPILMAPMSNVRNLGLYTVANTISDLPLIVALGIAGAVFGVNSRATNASQVLNTSRLSVLGSLIGCTAVAITIPLWIGPLFGDQFEAATVPTMMLMGSAVICIPGLMAAAGLSAWGRPGIRSVGSTITLVTNLAALVILVPRFGVYGAAWTSVLANLVMSTYMVLACRRVMNVRASEFFLVRRADVARLWFETRRLAAKIVPTRSRGRHSMAATSRRDSRS